MGRTDVTASSAVAFRGRASVSSARRHHPHIYRRLSNCPSLISRALKRCYSPSLPSTRRYLPSLQIARNKVHDQSAIEAAQAAHSTSKLTSKLSLLRSLSALDDPAVAGAAHGGVLFADFPLREHPSQQDTADPTVSCPKLVSTANVAVRLLSLPVSVWVVCLASRETARDCRPSDLLTSRHHQSGRSRGEISSTPGCLSPQNPHPTSVQTTGIPERGIACIYVISVHACLVWTGPPCGWPSTTATLPLQPCI